MHIPSLGPLHALALDQFVSSQVSSLRVSPVIEKGFLLSLTQVLNTTKFTSKYEHIYLLRATSRGSLAFLEPI